MKKAIIFDLGGVIVDLDVEACKKAFKEDIGYMDIDEDLDACHQKGVIGALEEGLIGIEEFHSRILSRCRPGAVGSDVDRCFRKILKGIRPEKVDLIKKMSEDHDLYILSNNNEVCFPRCREMFEEAGLPMDVYFKQSLCSYQIKALKPSLQFYKAAIDVFGIKPEDAVFIDDSQKNVEGSIAAGLPAVWFDINSDLADTLARALAK